MSFPLLVRTAQSTFAEVSGRLEDIARTLGADEWRVFTSITFPLGMPGIVAGTVLAFARAVGEFGATAIVAGSHVFHAPDYARAISSIRKSVRPRP